MKKLLSFIIILKLNLFPQSPAFYPQELLRLEGPGMGFNVEVHDINKDGKEDIIVGNWNDTYVYFGGADVLDDTVDIVYTGRCLAVCDYNGDGYKDVITMQFTNYDSTRNDYDGEILYYYGKDSIPTWDTNSTYSVPLPTLYPTKDYFSLGLGRPGIEYGDFNKDEKSDIVINSLDARPDLVGVVYVYMGDEIPPDTATYSVSGKFVPGQAPVSFYGHYFQVADINVDGYDDLLLSSKISKVPPALNPTDSLDVLHIYLGNENFKFVKNGESLRYESTLKNSNYSYGWFKREFSMMDINGDGFNDLLISHYYKDSTLHVYYGSKNVIDTIPSFYLTDPDTAKEDIIIGQSCHDIGDWNNDGYNDFLLNSAGFKTFSAHLGGPYLSNRNPYGLRGLLEACYDFFPNKAVSCNDQNGDGIKDYVVTATCGFSGHGYVIIFKGRDDILVSTKEEKKELISGEFYIEQNFPNPFNPFTIIQYTVGISQNVT
ncbi:MAG: FG-GAP repeat domain-containing protein, partial [Ignavibacteria bacterium]